MSEAGSNVCQWNVPSTNIVNAELRRARNRRATSNCGEAGAERDIQMMKEWQRTCSQTAMIDAVPHERTG